MVLPQANAQTVTAVQDTTCLGPRAGNTTCSAGEFTVAPTFVAAPGTPLFCTAGQSININVTLGLSGTNTNRYDIGFFTGQIGNDPRAVTAGTICSAAIFPESPSPWSDFDAQVLDTCGDFLGGGVANPLVQNVKARCEAAIGTDLSVPYVLTYSQNGSQVCNSAGRTGDATVLPGDVTNAAPSKCNAGSAVVNVGVTPIQVAGFVDVTKQTLPDGDSQSFSFTATGPVGSILGTSTDGGTTIVSAGTNTVTVNRTDGQTIRIYMSITSTSRTLSIVEAATTSWETSSSISCAAVTGSPTRNTNNATRTATAGLDTTNSAAACTFTNTKKSRITIAKTVGGRVNALDQFTVSASAGVGNTLTTDAGVSTTSPVSVSTSGAGTSVSSIFRSTPGLALTITDAMAGGSVSTLSDYVTSLTCTNAFAGSGATSNASLPSNSNVSTLNLIPAPGDDITCTYTNTPKPRITLQKAIAAAGGGRVSGTDQFALTAGTSTGTTTGAGTNVTSGALLFVGTAGSAVTISEAAAGTTTLSNYSTSITCANSNGASATVLPSGSGTSFNLTPANNDVISCILTNTRRSATLSLRKVWVNALSGETATVTSSGFINNATSGLSTSTGNNTTTGTSVTVFAGESGSISEVLSNSGNYNAVLSCSGNTTTLVGNALTVNAADTAIVCTQTNTRRTATLILRKVWVNALSGETATVTSSGFINNATSGLSTSTGNNTTTGTAVNVFAGESGSISEVLSNSGNYNAVLSCSGNTTALVGSALTVNAADTAIVCTQTNTRRTATLILRKVWVNALSGETATVTSSGFINNATSGLSTSTGNNTTAGPAVTVFVGESGSISEVLSNSGNYNAVLSCTGNTTALVGTTLTVNAADTAIVCTQTNTRKADMVVNISGLPVTAVIGTPYSGTYTCTNSGGSIATSATCSVSGLPAGLTASCLPVPPANLAIGASITCTVSGSPTTAGSNNVTVTTSATNEGDTTNNLASTTILVSRQADLSITKTDSPDPVIAGNALTYVISVTNNGPSTITASDTFTVTDALPSGLSSCTHTSSAGSYTVGTGAWTGVALAVNGSATLTIVCTVDANFSGTSLSNTASVAPPSGVSDPSAGNDSAGPVITTVNRVADLSVSKTDGITTVVAGGTTTYTVVVSNTGPSNANNAVVTDSPSAGLVLTNVTCASAGGATCPVSLAVGALISTGLIVPLLPPGGSVTLTVTANVTATGQ